MEVLFITSSRLGDAVLSAGLLDHIVRAYPAARFTVVCGPLPAPLFEGLPGLKEIIVLKKRSWNRHWLALWRRVAGRRWDFVVDLRDSAVSRLIRADRKFIFGKHIDGKLHKAEQNAAVMKLDYVPAPRLWFTKEQERKAEELIPPGAPVLAVGPTANWRAKTWPGERFIELISLLTAPGGIMPGARVAVFAAPGEEEGARRVLAAVPESRRIDVIAKTDPGVAAAALARCDFYVGNDSGLMHCAAAVRVPVVGLFGPSWPHLYRPWGEHAAYAATPETFAQLTAYEGYSAPAAPCLMSSLEVREVLAVIYGLWNSAGGKSRDSQHNKASGRP